MSHAIVKQSNLSPQKCSKHVLQIISANSQLAASSCSKFN